MQALYQLLSKPQDLEDVAAHPHHRRCFDQFAIRIVLTVTVVERLLHVDHLPRDGCLSHLDHPCNDLIVVLLRI
jgi:hypothetical protein